MATLSNKSAADNVKRFLKKSGIKLISILLLLLSGHICYSQQIAPSEKFDALVGLENTDLASGSEYIEKHVIRNNKHKYFRTPEFQTGTITYAGQEYLNIPLKYNVYDDLLLVRIANPGGESVFQLHQTEVQSFTFDTHRFVSIPLQDLQSDRPHRFYEILLDRPELRLLKKHRKKQKRHLDKNFTYYEFETDSPQFIISQNKILYPIKSRRDIINRFPEKEKIIRQFYRSNRRLFKSDQDRFFTNLLQMLIETPAKN